MAAQNNTGADDSTPAYACDRAISCFHRAGALSNLLDISGERGEDELVIERFTLFRTEDFGMRFIDGNISAFTELSLPNPNDEKPNCGYGDGGGYFVDDGLILANDTTTI